MSNLDKKLKPAQYIWHERREKNQHLIQERYTRAEKAEKATGVEAPTTVFSALQRNDAFTRDEAFDKSRESIVGMPQLPIKQFEVTPEGDWCIVVGEAAQEALREKKFCHNCYDPQPEDPQVWKEKASRLYGLIGEPPAGFKHGEHCCYCGAVLGYEVEYKDRFIQPEHMTPEQQKILGEITGMGALRQKGA